MIECYTSNYISCTHRWLIFSKYRIMKKHWNINCLHHHDLQIVKSIFKLKSNNITNKSNICHLELKNKQISRSGERNRMIPRKEMLTKQQQTNKQTKKLSMLKILDFARHQTWMPLVKRVNASKSLASSAGVFFSIFFSFFNMDFLFWDYVTDMTSPAKGSWRRTT